MIDYDLHIHTAYCGHAAPMTVKAICARAETLDLSAIAITDHIFAHKDHKIIQQIRDDVLRYDSQLKVYVGAEVDVADLLELWTDLLPPRGVVLSHLPDNVGVLGRHVFVLVRVCSHIVQLFVVHQAPLPPHYGGGSLPGLGPILDHEHAVGQVLLRAAQQGGQ